MRTVGFTVQGSQVELRRADGDKNKVGQFARGERGRLGFARGVDQEQVDPIRGCDLGEFRQRVRVDFALNLRRLGLSAFKPAIRRALRICIED